MIYIKTKILWDLFFDRKSCALIAGGGAAPGERRDRPMAQDGRAAVAYVPCPIPS